MISISKHLDTPCYRLLFYMSITDMCILWMLGFLHGALSLMGAVYCSYPKLIYICGSILSGFWISESVAEIALSVNRCIAILAPRLEKKLFGGWKVGLWMGASLGYGTWWAFFVKPVLFNGIHFTWFFNPYVGYLDDPVGAYNNILHIIWDMSVAVSIPVLYIGFIIIFNIKTHAFGVGKSVSHRQKMMLLQVFIISLFNFIACSVYVYMMYVIPSEWVLIFAQFCWLHIHGFPPVIYLVLNKTIRDDARRMAFYWLGKYPRLQAIKNMFTTTNSNRVVIPSQFGTHSSSIPGVK
ncbi:serpentine type 7TM GPCR chemoreceptor srt domain-containing protein [Ditylenchus destructor]|uniref:Serpentine type 7TM GPCR chemoreceptor srt domain-containing protein n=1 Tax=Ditylenchus destructor TaxID=166010 RepID=A0AAD4NER2_9BILA|nr:serpentine type 7TM GPCR chemoreceptor srt domain-containing protein [Ditylenchus destructor]